MTVRTRFAPSPTGLLHIGGVRTALYAWAFARHHGGEFVLRIEDTDVERSTPASVAAILDGMDWLGLDHDVGPIRQTDRLDRYRTVADQLVQSGHAFRCYDQPAAGGAPKGSAAYRSPWRNGGQGLPVPAADAPYTVRFKAPLDGETGFHDLVKGTILTPHTQIEDWVLVRSSGMPTYNFAVVVDDADMAISHVIRGDDHVANTAKQIQLYHALGQPVPAFAHLPMILDEQGKKLSKRTQGHTDVFPADVASMRDQGLLPVALLNYLARLGWSHGDDEVFDLDRFVGWFDLNNVSPSPARVDRKKLHWTNAQHLKNLPDAALLAWAQAQPGVGPLDLGDRWADVATALRTRGADTKAWQQDVQRLAAFVTASRAPVVIAPDDASYPAWVRWSGTLDLDAWDMAGLDAGLRAAAADTDVPFGTFAKSVRTALTDAPVSLPIPIMLMAMGREVARAWLNDRVVTTPEVTHGRRPGL